MILICGPCTGEQSEQWVVDQAGAIADQLADFNHREFIFKCSFDKANRTNGGSYRGLGIEATLRALQTVKQQLGCLTTTDVHEPWQVREVADVVDVIQIPAMLCRQTDLIKAASVRVTGVVNLKCGTGATAEEMEAAAEKVRDGAWLTYRGTSICNRIFFLPEQLTALEDINPHRTVLLDVTHIARDVPRLGEPWNPMSLTAAQCGLALGIDGLFMEVHPDPSHALSDRQMQIKLSSLATFLEEARWE